MERTLFSEFDLRASMEAHRAQLVDEIKQAPEQHVLQADANSWAESLAARWAMVCAQIDPDALYMDYPEACQIDDSAWPGRDVGYGSSYVEGHRTTVHLPFSGDGDTLRMQPSRYHFGPKPSAEIHGDRLDVSIEYPDDRPIDIDGTVRNWVSQIERELRVVEADLSGFAEGLEQEARTAIAARKERILRHREVLAKSSIPIRDNREAGKTYVVDAIERRPPPAAKAMSLNGPLPLEPIISDELYEDIVATLSGTGRNLERSAGTYADMGEEDLRQVLLLPLNDRYRGQGTAETFNSEGKADLVLRWENQNLFVCEMKIWSGEKGFVEAVAQLFGYATWRDTGLALVVFVKQKGMSAVIDTAREALSQQDYFVESTGEFEGGLQALIKQPRDEGATARLSVLFVHLAIG